jgi:hypothetical protein
MDAIHFRVRKFSVHCTCTYTIRCPAVPGRGAMEDWREKHAGTAMTMVPSQAKLRHHDEFRGTRLLDLTESRPGFRIPSNKRSANLDGRRIFHYVVPRSPPVLPSLGTAGFVPLRRGGSVFLVKFRCRSQYWMEADISDRDGYRDISLYIRCLLICIPSSEFKDMHSLHCRHDFSLGSSCQFAPISLMALTATKVWFSQLGSGFRLSLYPKLIRNPKGRMPSE